NLQEDDNSDGAANAADDDEFQYNCVVSPAGPCAISGGGWQQISIPLADFFDDNSFFTGGNGVLDAVPVASGGNGQLINVVIAIIGNSGSDVNFRTDYWAFSDGPLATPTLLIDDFENGLPSGTDGDGNPIGFFTFSDGSPIGIGLTDAPPAPVPGSNSGNNVLAMTGNVASFAGFIHAFENLAVDSWVPQDWSAYEGLSFWLYGHNSGTTLFVDVIDNRNPGSTQDDAERFSVTLTDNFSGWQFFELPFSSFTRKEIGNGAPNDGFTLTQVHGWALGTLNTPGEITYYLDDAALYGVAEIPELAVTFAAAEYEIEEGATGQITVKLNRSLNSDDPAQVSIDYFTEPATATPGLEYTPASGTLTFVNGGPSELTFALETFDDTKWEGTERVILRLTNPVDIGAGFALQAAAAIIDNDAYDPNLIDDFERGTALLTPGEITVLETMELNAGDALAIPGQDTVETVLRIAPAAGEAPRAVLFSSRDAVAGLLPTGNSYADRKLNDVLDQLDHLLLDSNWHNDYYFSPGAGKQAMHDLTWSFIKLVQASDKAPQIEAAAYDILVDLFVAGRDLAHLSLDLAIASDGKPEKIGYAEAALAAAEDYLAEEQYYQALMQYRVVVDQAQKAVAGIPLAPLGYTHEFPLGQDWSHGEALTFWYYGQNSGDTVTVQLLDNRAPDPGPAGWSLAWSDEFNEPAG
ncbi:MAG: hypothetical protein KDE04_20855, partial [Anaerolineales bacterium]|nr:hypothetical protein [Anaerolineales bacterium]